MKKELSLDSALSQLRRAVDEERSRAKKIKELAGLLDETMVDRSVAVEAALSTLRGYVRLHSGFAGGPDKIFADSIVTEAVADRCCERFSTKKKAEKKVAKSSPKSRPKLVTKGYPADLDSSIKLSPVEQKFVDLLKERWPRFTTAAMLVRHGVIPAKPHATCKVNQLRKKGVPIESARQARNSGEKVSDKAKGYRLIEVVTF